MEFIIDENNFINFRKTPWDTNSLGINTSEITIIKASSVMMGQQLIEYFDTFNKENNIEFAYIRIDANSVLLKQLFLQNKFYQAETSFQIFKNNIQSYEYRIPKVQLINLAENCTPSIVEEIKIIARDSFDYSRFHEDNNILNDKARNRYYNWIDDLINQKKEIFYIVSKGETIGFHVQEILDKNHANLILTGCKKGKSELALPLWHTSIVELKNRGINSVSTLISANNVGVLNLYIYLQFKVRSSLLGMHKIYS